MIGTTPTCRRGRKVKNVKYPPVCMGVCLPPPAPARIGKSKTPALWPGLLLSAI